MLIKARYKEYGGFPRDLERDIDMILQTEQAAPEGADGQAPPAHRAPGRPHSGRYGRQGDAHVCLGPVHALQNGDDPTAIRASGRRGRPVSSPPRSRAAGRCPMRGPHLTAPRKPGHVLMVAMEDNLGAVIPRLEQCGADLSRIAFVMRSPMRPAIRPFTLADLPLPTRI